MTSADRRAEEQRRKRIAQNIATEDHQIRVQEHQKRRAPVIAHISNLQRLHERISKPVSSTLVESNHHRKIREDAIRHESEMLTGKLRVAASRLSEINRERPKTEYELREESRKRAWDAYQNSAAALQQRLKDERRRQEEELRRRQAEELRRQEAEELRRREREEQQQRVQQKFLHQGRHLERDSSLEPRVEGRDWIDKEITDQTIKDSLEYHTFYVNLHERLGRKFGRRVNNKLILFDENAFTDPTQRLNLYDADGKPIINFRNYDKRYLLEVPYDVAKTFCDFTDTKGRPRCPTEVPELPSQSGFTYKYFKVIDKLEDQDAKSIVLMKDYELTLYKKNIINYVRNLLIKKTHKHIDDRTREFGGVPPKRKDILSSLKFWGGRKTQRKKVSNIRKTYRKK